MREGLLQNLPQKPNSITEKAEAHALLCEAERQLTEHRMVLDRSMESIQAYRAKHGRAKNGSMGKHLNAAVYRACLKKEKFCIEAWRTV